jgi:hypothetical protein
VKNKLPVPFSILQKEFCKIEKLLIATQRRVICRLAAGDTSFFSLGKCLAFPIYHGKSCVMKSVYNEKEDYYDRRDYDSNK